MRKIYVYKIGFASGGKLVLHKFTITRAIDHECLQNKKESDSSECSAQGYLPAIVLFFR
jgi:hypothetical protein